MFTREAKWCGRFGDRMGILEDGIVGGFGGGLGMSLREGAGALGYGSTHI